MGVLSVPSPACTSPERHRDKEMREGRGRRVRLGRHAQADLDQFSHRPFFFIDHVKWLLVLVFFSPFLATYSLFPLSSPLLLPLSPHRYRLIFHHWWLEVPLEKVSMTKKRYGNCICISHFARYRSPISHHVPPFCPYAVCLTVLVCVAFFLHAVLARSQIGVEVLYSNPATLRPI